MTESLPFSNLKLIVAYAGEKFFGFEETKEGPSIENALSSALFEILQERPQLFAASRTDRGVHATGQVINFLTQKTLDCTRLQKSLNALLPREIRILGTSEMDLSFHATLDAKEKEYRYEIDLGAFQSPFRIGLAWHLPYPLQINLMKESLPLFLGKKDFSSFANAIEGPSRDPLCEISSLQLISEGDNQLTFRIKGSRFLYKMVRNIIGTIVSIGRKKIKLEDLSHLFAANRREEAGMTAPSHGLYLERVFYEK